MIQSQNVQPHAVIVREDTPIPVTPEVAPIEKNKPRRSAKPKREQPEKPVDSILQSHPVPEATESRLNSESEPVKPAPNGSPKPVYEWDRTIEETRQREAAKLETERLSRIPLPPPKAKTLPWVDFCEYWNSIRELPVAPCIRLYVQRWLPVLLPIVEVDRFGGSKESHPSDLRILASDGALSEDLILQLGGVGDYTFRLNDTRRPWEQGTVCQSQLETKRLWDIYPPVFDLKRLDYDDKKNQVYIKFARARGILPREDEQEKESEMANVTAITDRALDEASKERARADQIQQEQLNRARAEAESAKAAIARAESEAAEARRLAEELKTRVQPGTPASELLSVVSSVATLANSLKPAADNSLKDFLALEAQREQTRRERDKEERDAARETARLERERADRLQAEVIAIRTAPAPAAIVPAAPKTDVELMEEMVKKQTLLNQLTGRKSPTVEEERPSNIDKWLEAAPIIGPVVQSFIGGIFQTIHFGFQTWQQISYNNALIKNGQEPKPPMTQNTKSPEPGQPAPPTGPQLTPEQQAQQQQLQVILGQVAKLVKPLDRALGNSQTGAEFAEKLIDFSDDGRVDYDRIRNVAETLTRLGVQIPPGPGIDQFKNAAAFLFQHFPQFWQKVANLPTFGTFLEEFYEYDKIAAQQEAEQS